MINELVTETLLCLQCLMSLTVVLGSLNKEEFIEAFDSILDQSQYRQLLEKLFDKVYQILI